MAGDLSVEAIYNQWVASIPSDAPPRDREKNPERLRAVFKCRGDAVNLLYERMQEPSAADWAWLLDALVDTDALAPGWSPWTVPPRIRVAAMAIANVSPLPPEMFSLLVRAAVYDLDLSGPRFFIDPCSRVFGTARTTNAIVGYLDHGTDFEKAGAASALYHAFFRFIDPSPIESEETLGTASRRAIVALLRAFLQNEDIHVVRAAIRTLGLFRPGECSGELRDLADQVIAVGSEHADEYTRWCIRSWAGAWTADGPEYPPRPRPEGAGSGAR